MPKLRLRISMSLDGFVAGPSQSVQNPLGIGGMRLHEWAFPLAQWRAMHGLEGGEVNESSRMVEESLANIGATVMGRNMFGGHPGPWPAKEPWNGWWGTNPPYHHPVFVLTHHARARRRHDVHLRDRRHRDGTGAGPAGRRRQGCVARRRRESCAAVPGRRPRGRDGDQPRADAPRER